MRLACWILLIAACGKSSSTNEGSGAPTPVVAAAPAIDGPATRPPDDMDEKMRHCPLAVEGASVVYASGSTGTRWEITASTPAAIDEIRKRASHVVEFAAGRSEKGVHGGGKGGGRMRNCPIVTSGVVITLTEIEGGARLLVAPAKPEDLEPLRLDTNTRVKAFVFPGVKVVEQTAP